MQKVKSALVVSILFLAIPCQSRELAVLQPGAPATAEEAMPYLKSFCGYLQGKLGGKALDPVFISDPEKAAGYLSKHSPAYAMISIGIYLSNAKTYHMKPLAQIVVHDKKSSPYYIMAKKGTFTNLEDLKGKTLAGNIFFEPEIFFKLALKGRFKSGDFKIKSTTRTLRFIRKAARGKIDAVVINERAYDSLGDIKLPAELSVIAKTLPVPNPVFVGFENRDSVKDEAAMLKALLQLCDDEKGKKICKNFGFDRLDAVSAKDLPKPW
ncbi:MAG: phosphate/phosphite/phosphonate ABC transporter substrate-binding protein [Deltaproteobacteria bacterium]|nr:phosphate/phosphite/phosphonate ABC transporter substrate-binding protein [Deltaproteobacteria bacterium]